MLNLIKMKIVYYLFLILASILTVPQSASAQKDSSGIYKTAEDFRHRKLTYAINCTTEKHKISPDILFKGSIVKIRHQGNTFRLNKSDVFGYRTCEGKEYRFVNNLQYLILNPGEMLILYLYQQPVQPQKNAVQTPPKYFFSINENESLRELTKDNLKFLYPDNHKFHDELDAQFRDDKDLYAYDSFHKMYKINWILKNL
jgi:hypothetical protein